MSVERHDIVFQADIQKIRQYLICIKEFCKKIENELDDGVIRAGGQVPERRVSDRRKIV